MRIILCLSLVVVATVNSDTLTGVSVQSGEVSQGSTTPPEYSRVNQEVYKTRQTGSKNSHVTPPPIPKFPTSPTRSAVQTVSVTPKASKTSRQLQPIPHKTSSVHKKVDDEDDRPLTYRVRTYSDQEENSIADTDSHCDDFNDSDSDHEEYQPNDYSVAPTQSATYAPQPAVYSQQPPVYAQEPTVYAQQRRVYAQQPPVYAQQPVVYSQQPAVYAQQPPVYGQQPAVYAQPPPVYRRQPAVYAPQPPAYGAYERAIRRGFRSSAYNRPFYAGILKAASPLFRSVEYARPVTYAVPIPSVRRVTYGPAPVRYIRRPSVAYEGIGGVEYDNVVNVDYDEVKK